MPLAPGTHLGPYEILVPPGVGGMGEIYRARDIQLGRDLDQLWMGGEAGGFFRSV